MHCIPSSSFEGSSRRHRSITAAASTSASSKDFVGAGRKDGGHKGLGVGSSKRAVGGRYGEVALLFVQIEGLKGGGRLQAFT